MLFGDKNLRVDEISPEVFMVTKTDILNQNMIFP